MGLGARGGRQRAGIDGTAGQESSPAEGGVRQQQRPHAAQSALPYEALEAQLRQVQARQHVGAAVVGVALARALVRRLLRLRRRQCSQGGRRRVPAISSYSEASESRQGTPRTSLRIATGLDRARERPNSARGSFSDVSHSLGDDELALALDALRAAEASGTALTGVRAVERLMRAGHANSREEAALLCSVLARQRFLTAAGPTSMLDFGMASVSESQPDGAFEAGASVLYRSRARTMVRQSSYGLGSLAGGGMAIAAAVAREEAYEEHGGQEAYERKRRRGGPPAMAYRALVIGWAATMVGCAARPGLALALSLAPALAVLGRVEQAVRRQQLLQAEARLLRRLVQINGGAGGGAFGGGAPAIQALLEEMWPGWLSPYLSRLTSRLVGNALARRAPPKMLSELRLARFRLGRTPPALADLHVLTGAQSGSGGGGDGGRSARGGAQASSQTSQAQQENTAGDHATVVDIELVADMPELFAELTGREAKLGIPVRLTLSGATVKGRVRVRLEWLPWPPHMRLLTVQFLTPPEINFVVSGATDIPGVEAWLRAAIDKMVRSTLVAPHEVRWDAEAFWARRRLPVMWAAQKPPPRPDVQSLRSPLGKRRASGYEAVDNRGVAIDATAWLAVSVEAAEGLGGGHQRGEVRCRLAHAQGTARRSAVSSPPAEATAGRCAWNTPAPATFEVVQWLEDACVEVDVYHVSATSPVRSLGSCVLHAAHFLQSAEMTTTQTKSGRRPSRSSVLWIDLAPQGCGRLKVRVLMYAPRLEGLVTTAPGAGVGRLRPALESTSGWLAKVHVKGDIKHGFGYMSNWKRRYFVLTPSSGEAENKAERRQAGMRPGGGGTLNYYRDSSCEDTRGEELLSVATEACVLTVAQIRAAGAPVPPERLGGYAFGLAPPNAPMFAEGTLLMIADSKADRDRWLAALGRASSSHPGTMVSPSPMFMRAQSYRSSETGSATSAAAAIVAAAGQPAEQPSR